MAKNHVLIHFDGVSVASDFMTGTIASRDLIKHFDRTWIPSYQRERVMSKRKISSLVGIFKEGRKIDSIKLNLRGEICEDKKTGDAILEGMFSVIDGQQRLFALRDSGADHLRVPIELYLNIPLEEEVRLFHQFNKEATKLKFGELAKSTQGEYGKLVQKLLRPQTRVDIPIVINGGKTGMGLSVIAPLIHYIHKRQIEEVHLQDLLTGKNLLKFLEKPFDANTVMRVEFALKNVLSEYAKIFGNFDHRALAYRRAMLHAFTKVAIREFVEPTGKVDYRKFKKRIYEIPSMFMKNSVVMEKISQGTQEATIDLEIFLIEYLNRHMKHDQLKVPARTLKFGEQQEEEGGDDDN